MLDRRQIVVPIAKVARFGDEVHLTLSASDLAGLDLYNAERLQAMPDHWEMPAGFDQREFFLVGGAGGRNRCSRSSGHRRPRPGRRPS